MRPIKNSVPCPSSVSGHLSTGIGKGEQNVRQRQQKVKGQKREVKVAKSVKTGGRKSEEKVE